MSAAVRLAAAPAVRRSVEANAAGAVLSLAEAERLRPSWARLAQSAAEDNLFFHPDFLVPAIACFGRGRVALATVWAGGRAWALAPFTAARLGHLAPAVRLWTHPYGPLGVPLLAADAARTASRVLLATLSPPQRGHAVIIPEVDLDGPVAAAVVEAAGDAGRSTAILGRYRRAIARRRGDAGHSCADLSRHRRKEYGRLMRRLAETGRVTVDAASDPEAVRSAFDEFAALEAAGWKGVKGSALASQPERLCFARAAIAARAAAGEARIHGLRLDGRLIAGLVTLIAGATAFTWKIAYDEECARFSPGAQVMLAAIRDLLAGPAIGRIDSCAGGNHPLADPLLADRAEMGTLVILPVQAGPLYRAALAAAKIEAAAIAATRRLRHQFRG